MSVIVKPMAFGVFKQEKRLLYIGGDIEHKSKHISSK